MAGVEVHLAGGALLVAHPTGAHHHTEPRELGEALSEHPVGDQ